MSCLSRIAPVVFSLIIFAAVIAPVHAQKEFPPPQGKGRVVVVVSGADGAAAYQGVSWQIAQFGYDAVLFDGNDIMENGAVALRTAIEQAQQMPHATPGKVGLVGFSRGGGEVLLYGSQMSDVASVVVAWYPGTTRFILPDVSGFIERLRLPVLMFAGEADIYRGCCLISTARSLASTARSLASTAGSLAAAAGRQFELVTYPNTQHSFIYGGRNYNPQAYADAMQRTAAKLAQYLGH